MRQLGYDQRIIIISYEIANSNAFNAKTRFIGQGRDQILENFEKTFWPGRARAGYVSKRCSVLEKCFEAMHNFVNSKDEDTLEVALPVAV